MVTAQAPLQLSEIEQLEKLQADSVSYIKQGMEQRGELQRLLAENEQQQQAIKNRLFSGTNGAVSAPVVVAAPVKTRGRKPGKVAAPKAAKVAKATKASKSGKNYSNPTSLRATCWNILARKANQSGRNVAEITDIIEKEKLWKSSAEDITQMVQQAVYKLKSEGKLDRKEDGNYIILAGATL